MYSTCFFFLVWKEQAPVNCNDVNSDIDSGDENVVDGDVSVFSGNQLLGCAVLEMKLTNSKVVRGDEENKNDNQDLPPEPKKEKKKPKVKHINKSKHSYDLPVIDDFKWNLPIPAIDLHEPPSSLFGKFLTDDLLQFICTESVIYALNKGNYSYKLELHDLEAFIAILPITFKNNTLLIFIYFLNIFVTSFVNISHFQA